VTYLPKKAIFCAILILLVFGGVFTFSMLDACPVEKKTCTDQRLPVAFPHDMHMGQYDCLDCHHVFDQQHNNILDPGELYAGNPLIKCESCHGAESQLNREEAFHGQCIGCHFKSGGIDQAGGPNLCGECHKDNKGAGDFVMILGETHD